MTVRRYRTIHERVATSKSSIANPSAHQRAKLLGHNLVCDTLTRLQLELRHTNITEELQFIHESFILGSAQEDRGAPAMLRKHQRPAGLANLGLEVQPWKGQSFGSGLVFGKQDEEWSPVRPV